MKVRVHGKNLPKKFRLGVYVMTELTLRDLLGKSRVIKNLEIDIHFRHHADNGEAMIHENEFRSRPRMFRVVIDPYKTRIDDYGRERSDEEHANEMFKVLGHELVHVKQYVVGDMSMRSKGMYWKGELTKIDNMMEYFKSPWEIEAYGLERYLWMNFIDFWKSNVEKHLEEKE